MSRSILKKPLVHEDAWLTSIVRYGESDCIVRLFLESQGRVVAFFKQGLAPKKKHGSIQSPALARVSYVAPDDQKMLRLSSCDMAPDSFLWATSMKHFAYANYLAELIEKLLPEAEPAPEVFWHLFEAQKAIFKHGPQAQILRRFELKILLHLGYLPEFPEYIDDMFYDPIECQFSKEERAFSFKISKEALLLAAKLLSEGLNEIICDDEESLKQVGRIFYSRLRLLGLLPLNSIYFFKEIKH